MNNRYGVDVKYFQKTVEREMAGIENQTPSDLARVFARLSRTSDPDVMLEPEFANKHLKRIEELEGAIEDMGNRYNECTRGVTGKTCKSCECKYKSNI